VKHITLEIYVEPSSNTAHCLRDKPSYGETHEPTSGHRQRVVLNDGQHRVKIGVYGRTLPLEDIKRIARVAVSN